MKLELILRSNVLSDIPFQLLNDLFILGRSVKQECFEATFFTRVNRTVRGTSVAFLLNGLIGDSGASLGLWVLQLFDLRLHLHDLVTLLFLNVVQFFFFHVQKYLNRALNVV